MLKKIRDRWFTFGSSQLINPWRREHPLRPSWVRALLSPVVFLGVRAGFRHVGYSYIHGDPRRLQCGQRVSLMDTTFNLVSGHVQIGDDTLFSHGCYVLTGMHRFVNGQRASLQPGLGVAEVPADGRDIRIGTGCFIGAGSIILGGVSIGDNVIVGAGAVVTSDVATGQFVAGIPAGPLRRLA